MSQQSSADSLDPFELLPASLFFHVFVSTVGHKGSVKDGPERPQTNYSPSHAQFLSHQNDLVLQKDVLIVGKANISSKREIFFFMWGWGGILDIDKLHYSRRDVFKKKKILNISCPTLMAEKSLALPTAYRGRFARLLTYMQGNQT